MNKCVSSPSVAHWRRRMDVSGLTVLLLASYCLSLLDREVAAEPCGRGTQCHGGPETGDTRPCVGEHCPGGRSSRPRRHLHYHTASSPRAAAASAVADGFAPPHPPPPPQRHFHTANETRDCRGIECKLPLRIRLQPRPKPPCAAGDACPAAGYEDGQPVHLRDRAAQFMGEFPEFGYPSSELGGAPLGVQLTCDIKPGDTLFCIIFTVGLLFISRLFYYIAMQPGTIISLGTNKVLSYLILSYLIFIEYATININNTSSK